MVRPVYKFLLFDADDTLLDTQHDLRESFQYLYHIAGFDAFKPYSEAMHELYNACNNRWWKRFEHGECTKAELFRQRFRDFLTESGLPFRDPDELNSIYFEKLGQTCTPFPGAFDLLEKLAKDFEIYIVTNGNASSQKTRFEISKLTERVCDYFISEVAGAAKPDKRYFDYVLSHIPGASPEDCIVIGDSLSSDMRGAENAGIDSIWYNPHKSENTLHVPITFEAAGYDAVAAFLLNKKA